MSIPNNPNFGVSAYRGDDAAAKRSRSLQGQKDFHKILKDKDEERQDEEAIAETRQNDDIIKTKQASAKSKRPSLHSLAGIKEEKEPELDAPPTLSGATAKEDAHTSEADEEAEVEVDPSKIAGDKANAANEAIAEAAAQASGATQTRSQGKLGSATDEEPKRGRKSAAELAQAQAKQVQDPDGRVLRGLFSILNEEIPNAKKDNQANSAADSPFALYQNINKTKESSRFAQEQPDLTYVNPLAGAVNAPSAAVQGSEVKPTARAPYVQEIIEHMVKEMQLIQDHGWTETTITIQNSKMFEGAQLVITGFDSAMKEYNLSFNNLSPDAKQLLDLQQNQMDLKNAMAEKGFTVHIIVTTTETENNYRGGDQSERQGYADREDQSEGKNQS